MFIRTKKIKGNDYAYLSENKWSKRSKKVKQITKKYLGRVYKFDKIKDIEFDYNNSLSPGEIIKELVILELKKHGFEKNKNIYEKDCCFVDLKENRVYGSRGSIAIGMNQGLLSDYTLRRLFHYTRIKDGYDYAKKFIEAGLDIPKEAFIDIYNKIFKEFEDDDENDKN